MMFRHWFGIAAALTTPAIAAPDTATCEAAAERMLQFVEEDARASNKPLGKRMQTESGRKELVMETAKNLAEDPAMCAMLLSMPDSSLRAFARAQRPD